MLLTAELLTSLFAILLSLLASYLPSFSTWFEPKPPTFKRLFMLASLALITLAIFALACTSLAPLLGISLTCDQPGAIQILTAFITAVIANQSAYAISPRKAPAKDFPA